MSIFLSLLFLIVRVAIPSIPQLRQDNDTDTDSDDDTPLARFTKKSKHILYKKLYNLISEYVHSERMLIEKNISQSNAEIENIHYKKRILCASFCANVF